ILGVLLQTKAVCISRLAAHQGLYISFCTSLRASGLKPSIYLCAGGIELRNQIHDAVGSEQQPAVSNPRRKSAFMCNSRHICGGYKLKFDDARQINSNHGRV